MQTVSSFCEDKLFFQTPFFIDFTKFSLPACLCFVTLFCLLLYALEILFQKFEIFFSNRLHLWKCTRLKKSNEVKWRFLYAWRTRNFSHYLEHIKERCKKFTFHMMTIGPPFYYLALSASEPMIISEITAAHKKAIRKGPSLDSSKRH